MDISNKENKNITPLRLAKDDCLVGGTVESPFDLEKRSLASAQAPTSLFGLRSPSSYVSGLSSRNENGDIGVDFDWESDFSPFSDLCFASPKSFTTSNDEDILPEFESLSFEGKNGGKFLRGKVLLGKEKPQNSSNAQAKDKLGKALLFEGNLSISEENEYQEVSPSIQDVHASKESHGNDHCEDSVRILSLTVTDVLVSLEQQGKVLRVDCDDESTA